MSFQQQYYNLKFIHDGECRIMVAHPSRLFEELRKIPTCNAIIYSDNTILWKGYFDYNKIEYISTNEPNIMIKNNFGITEIDVRLNFHGIHP